jgi:hypothetical protein
MRTTLSLLLLSTLGLVLYRLWPAEAVDALRSDSDGVLQELWSDQESGPGRDTRHANSARARASLQEPPPGALRVLFVGNSHTQRNSMPSMLTELAAATPGARPFFFKMEAPGGAKLVEHVQRGRVATLLAEQVFDYVVLQEQQQWPSFEREQRQREFEAPAGTLDVLIRAAGAKTWLFLTYARRDGDRPNRPGDTYAQMQARTRDGYRDAARAIGASVVPVGLVWERVLRADPDLALWDADGYHPSRLGSYLAACIFYKAFYDRSPEGNPFHAGLSPDVAARLQRAAGLGTALYAPHEL